MQLFKVLDKNGRTYRGYKYDPLPAPGVALPALDDVELCAAGYHAALDPTKWRGSIPYADVRIWLVELGGEVRADNQKVAASEMRWVQELHGDWPYLSLFPAAKAMLMAGWRAENPEGDWPNWAYLTDADLARANLAGANLAGANLAGAYLTDAYLTGANLADANLTDANLTGANLARANLTRANLARAYLTDANLTDANLTGAYLTDANLTGANLGDWELSEDGFAHRKIPVAT